MTTTFNSNVKLIFPIIIIAILTNTAIFPYPSYVNADEIYDLPESTVETPPGQTSHILLTNDLTYLPEGKEAEIVYTQGIQGFEYSSSMSKGAQFEFEVAVGKNSTSYLQLDLQLSFDIVNRNEIENITYGETLIGIKFSRINIQPNQIERLVLEFNGESEWASVFYFGLIPNKPDTQYPNSSGDILPNSTIFVKTTVNVLYDPQEDKYQYLGNALILIAIVIIAYIIYNRYYKENSP